LGPGRVGHGGPEFRIEGTAARLAKHRHHFGVGFDHLDLGTRPAKELDLVVEGEGGCDARGGTLESFSKGRVFEKERAGSWELYQRSGRSNWKSLEYYF
jgi:hypothetical protein